MQQSRVAKRYAKSLMDFAQEQKNVDAVFNDVKLIENTIKTSRDFQLFLKSPLVSPKQKEEAMAAIYKGKISTETSKFLNLLAVKGRESELPNIINSFVALYQAQKNIVQAEVSTAIAIDDTLRAKIKKQIGSENVELVEKIDPSLIGGMILRIGDQQVDTSIKKQLSDLTQRLS